MPAGNAKDLKNNVQSFRNELRLTQEELAKSVNLTRQSIIAIEKGKFTPSIYTALRLARALNTDVENLFYIDERINS